MNAKQWYQRRVAITAGGTRSLGPSSQSTVSCGLLRLRREAYSMSPVLLLLSSLVIVVTSTVHKSHPRPASVAEDFLDHRKDKKGPVDFHSKLNLDRQWEAFKVDHGKSYVDALEEKNRKKIFGDNVKENEEHNRRYEKGLETYKRGINEFSDMTQPEFAKHITCLPAHNYSQEFDGIVRQVPDELYQRYVLPDAVDWRSEGAVTRVKNQGYCGSCWAFSAVGNLEGLSFRKTGELQTYSEQNLVDCATWRKGYGSFGCYGGWPHRALQYVKDNGGIDTEDSYQYEAENGRCRYDSRLNGIEQLRAVYLLPYGSESLLQRAVAFLGPVSVAIDASYLHQYRSGIFSSDQCSPYWINHAVLAVGYKTSSPGRDYWIVKNSWSTRFGMDGYILMSRNKGNQCGIASYVTFAL